MKETKFKTNIKCAGCIEKVTPALNETVGTGQWSVDLASPQRVLTITTDNIDNNKIKQALEKTGYQAEELG